MANKIPIALLATALFASASAAACGVGSASAGPVPSVSRIGQIEVSGNGVHRFSESIEHSRTVTSTGISIRSTEVIDLFGDLRGQILYHPVTEIDFGNQVLVNTGHQVFSGTVAGSAPVLLFDDQFRFEVDLARGKVRGQVFLERTLAGPNMFCKLMVEGPVAPPGQNSEFTYAGTCWGHVIAESDGVAKPFGEEPQY